MPKAHVHAPADTSVYIDHCVEILKKAGARITRPRLAVLECLATSRQSLGPKELLNMMRTGKKKPSVDLATIYRILETFAELGIVHRIGAHGAFVACDHVDCAVAMHVVTHCVACDKTQEVDLPPELQNAVSTYIKSATRFKPMDHFIQMAGHCSDCASRNKLNVKEQ